MYFDEKALNEFYQGKKNIKTSDENEIQNLEIDSETLNQI